MNINSINQPRSNVNLPVSTILSFFTNDRANSSAKDGPAANTCTSGFICLQATATPLNKPPVEQQATTASN